MLRSFFQIIVTVDNPAPGRGRMARVAKCVILLGAIGGACLGPREDQRPALCCPKGPLGLHQMLSFRSLAFILCSAMRRSRALSRSAFHCFPDRINGRKMATNMDTNTATSMASRMCGLLRTAYTKAIVEENCHKYAPRGNQRGRLDGSVPSSSIEITALSGQPRPIAFPNRGRKRYEIQWLCFNTERIVSNGNTSFRGSSRRRRAPKRSYQAAARLSFASIASATPPTSRATASARSPTANSRSPPSLRPCSVRETATG